MTILPLELKLFNIGLSEIKQEGQFIFYDHWSEVLDAWYKEKPKVYKIFRDGRRYNNKTFESYEEARKYVRRKVTALYGGYRDYINVFGFNITKS